MVCVNETPQCLSIQVTVGVSDQRDRKRIDTRIVFEVAGGELWKFVVITLGQVLANLAHLLFDDMEIINQPFSRGRDDMLFAN